MSLLPSSADIGRRVLVRGANRTKWIGILERVYEVESAVLLQVEDSPRPFRVFFDDLIGFAEPAWLIVDAGGKHIYVVDQHVKLVDPNP